MHLALENPPPQKVPQESGSKFEYNLAKEPDLLHFSGVARSQDDMESFAAGLYLILEGFPSS